MLADTWYMLVSTALRLLTGALLFVVCARLWGAEKFGSFMYPYAISALSVIIVDYGFNLQLVRDVARDPERVAALVWRSFYVKVFLAVLLISAAIAWTLLIQPGKGFLVLLWLLLAAAIANSFALLFNLPFRALGRFSEETKVVMWGNLALFLPTLALVALGYGPMMVAAGYTISRIVYLALSWKCFRQVVAGIGIRQFNWRDMSTDLRKGLPFGLHASLATLYFQVDTILIQHFLGELGVGVYQAGMRVIIGGLVLTEVLTNVYLPRLSRASNKKELVRISTRMTRHLLLLGTTGSLLIVVFAQFGIRTVFGAGYEQVSHLLTLLTVVFFLRYASSSYGALLTVSDRQTVRAVGVSVALAANIGLNLTLIPLYGLTGAALASIFTHIILTVIYVAFAWHQARSLTLEWRSVTLVLLAAIGVALILLLPPGGAWLKLGIGGVTVAGLAAFGVRGDECRSLSTSVLGRLRAQCGSNSSKHL